LLNFFYIALAAASQIGLTLEFSSTTVRGVDTFSKFEAFTVGNEKA